MQDRTHAAPASLSLALAAYGLAYLLVCVLAGDRPPRCCSMPSPPDRAKKLPACCCGCT